MYTRVYFVLGTFQLIHFTFQGHPCCNWCLLRPCIGWGKLYSMYT